ncbi:MAG: GNAT family N-acetyltransferase, partial [Oscillospiraceae bacterium]|nr:GNAT family N-acetyltransferase [Oscillospiraceae bacterium]
MTAEYGKPEDLDKWMHLVQSVRYNFPGLETEKGLNEHRDTVLEFMGREEALCVREDGEIMGVLLFSRKHNMICCLAVAPEHRRKGVASVLMDKALSELDRNRDITVSTFREDDEKGSAPRALYKKYGFEEGELVIEFGYPSQVFTLRATQDIDTFKLKDLQPSQFFISEDKLRTVESWFDPSDMSAFVPIPVKFLDGSLIMTDGHTRAVAALQSGLDSVPLVWDTDDLDWDMYRRCVDECRNRGVFSTQDLVSRILSADDYSEKWDKWCDKMQEDVIRRRELMSDIRLVRPSEEYI